MRLFARSTSKPTPTLCIKIWRKILGLYMSIYCNWWHLVMCVYSRLAKYCGGMVECWYYILCIISYLSVSMCMWHVRKVRSCDFQVFLLRGFCSWACSEHRLAAVVVSVDVFRDRSGTFRRLVWVITGPQCCRMMLLVVDTSRMCYVTASSSVSVILTITITSPTCAAGASRLPIQKLLYPHICRICSAEVVRRTPTRRAGSGQCQSLVLWVDHILVGQHLHLILVQLPSTHLWRMCGVLGSGRSTVLAPTKRCRLFQVTQVVTGIVENTASVRRGPVVVGWRNGAGTVETLRPPMSCSCPRQFQMPLLRRQTQFPLMRSLAQLLLKSKLQRQ